ncbi:MAG: flagellar basal body-associated FliL family protein [Alphaproteobacteria bacterium]|nr:flagellar basal body-associated FliL family protein [Alphaproteobacteria bacterium]
MAKEKEKDPKGKDSEEELDPKKEGEGGEETEGEGDSKKKLSTKLIIMIAAGGLLLVGISVGAALFFTGAFSSNKEPTPEEQHKASMASEEEQKGKAVFFSLGDLLVNLSGEGKRPNYLKVKISLELADEKDAALMDTLKPRIIDSFQVYLRELRIEDLRGSSGIYRLREALLLRVTEIAQPVRIRDVLFQEMLVQ